MLSSILNGIPGLGIVKAGGHILLGDTQGAKEAFVQSTRSTLVIAGGVAGCLGGPAGAVAGAMAAGALTDTVTSIATGEPRGMIEGIDDIVSDASNGDFPIGAIFKTTVIAGCDAISGAGASGVVQVAKSISTEAGKSVTQTVIRETLKVASSSQVQKACVASGMQSYVSTGDRQYGMRPARPERGKRLESSVSIGLANMSINSSTNAQRSAGSASGAGQPPRDNQNNRNNRRQNSATLSDLEFNMFLRIFGVQFLEDIVMGRSGIRIFNGLSDPQIEYLKKLIKTLISNGYLKVVIAIVRRIFDLLNAEDITFPNFLSLAEFIATYVGENVAEYVESFDDDLYAQRRQERINFICENASSFARKILDLFNRFRDKINTENSQMRPSFRNVFSAVYHWYKHRYTPNNTYVDIKEYFDLIKKYLNKLKTLRAFSDLIDRNHSRRDLKYEIFISAFGRRLRIILKIQNGHLELSSCYFVGKTFKGDKEDDEFVDGQHIIRF